MTEESVFAQAAAISDPHARAAFLDRACAGDPALRREVDELLAAHAVPSPLDRPAANLAFTGAYVPEAGATPLHTPGDRVGPYKLLEKIGEGGMGEVWVADQTEPIKRRVALKLIKPGMDSRAVLARFEAERQALALMDHPHIAKVLDAGTTPDGRPFFVMELVKGTPITDFCDARKLAPRERLELFVPVCLAIQHAHQKGIIHRDIKPSNVLVELHDEKPVAKVIDFGVAKAVGQQLTEKTLYTGFGALVGTPAYMAPEQATFNALDVDTRADVYALGVLLYELLAGSPPFDPERLRKAALDEVLRLVREEEPPRPSARLSTSEARASVAAVRRSDPAKLSALMRGELDWIVMKALEKDRTRRYDTATALAKDVQRYLTGDAVEACPPTLRYRLRKAYRKNRTAVRVAGAFALLLVSAAVVSGWLAMQARRAEWRANQNAEQASTNEQAARRAEGVADERRREALAREREANEARWATQDEVEKNDIKAMSIQVDLDLAELRIDPRAGLLRLARPMRDRGPPLLVRAVPADPEGEILTGSFFRSYKERPEYQALREFVTAAVVALGQEHAPLLPPITRDYALPPFKHDRLTITRTEISPDSKALLTFGADGAARLWDTRTAKLIAILRQGNEQVVSGGFSSDGKTVFTDDDTGVARFWEPADGKLRAQTARRPDNYTELFGKGAIVIVDGSRTTSRSSIALERSACAAIGRDRLVTTRVAVQAPRGDPKALDQVLAGPVELWDTATGRLVARLDRPGGDVREAQFLHDGEWVMTGEGGSTVVIFSAQDGREVARLAHPPGEVVWRVSVRPDGRRAAIVTRSQKDDRDLNSIQLWDTRTWRPASEKMSLPQEDSSYGVALWNHDLFGAAAFALGPLGGRSVLYRFGHPELLASAWSFQPDKSGDWVADGDGRVFDARTWKPLRPPAGRRYHPDLIRFALDGRFVNGRHPHTHNDVLIDIRTEKQFPTSAESPPMSHLPGTGLVAVTWGDRTVIQILPTALLDLSPNLLELWAQVVVRGELGPEGEFVKWDEPTWEKKRQELAAIPPPHPDLPFPGYVATDKLHWLRAEHAAATGADKPRLAGELLRRAEASGDRNEALRWRLELEKGRPYPAPPPRAVKP